MNLKERLKAIAEKTVSDCTFHIPSKYFGKDEERPILIPSGDNKYGSFWVRDSVMMAESGLVPTELLKLYLEIIAEHGQNGETEIHLENGLIVPPFAVADHINYDGGTVYFPGTYSSSADQGSGQYGFYPPFCDYSYFVILADCYLKQGGDRTLLHKEFHGYTLLDRLCRAIDNMSVDKQTGLCYSNPDAYTVDWGFCDSIRKTGLLIMPSLLRLQACEALSGICENETDKKHFAEIAKLIRKNIVTVFYDEESGWFYSSTGICHQHDVWATAFAVYLGIEVGSETADALESAYKNRTAVEHGYVRHILTTEDASDENAWEGGPGRKNRYQNGGYWSTPTGWYAKALWNLSRKESAVSILTDFVRHTDEYADKGSPFEWINADTTEFSGCLYGTSGVLPYIAWKDVEEK